MSVQELTTLYHICKLERTQLLTKLPMSVQNPQLAVYLLDGDRTNFLHITGSTAWLYDCPHFVSHPYQAEKFFDHIPIHYQDTVIYIDQLTRQFSNYANPV